MRAKLLLGVTLVSVLRIGLARAVQGSQPPSQSGPQNVSPDPCAAPPNYRPPGSLTRSDVDAVLAQHKLWMQSFRRSGKRAELAGASLSPGLCTAEPA